MSNLLPAFVLSVTSCGLAAQTTWQVGTPALPDINAAMAVAAPGDILVLGPAWYDPFVVTKGVTIIGEGNTPVAGPFGPTCVFDIPAGQEAYMYGVQIHSGSLEVLGGRVTLASCAVQPVSGNAALTVVDASVHLHRCNLRSGNKPALLATASDVTAVSGWFEAGAGAGMTEGVVSLEQSRFHATGVSITGIGWNSSTPAVGARNGSEAWLSDSWLTSQVCAIGSVGSTVRTDRCTIVESGVGCASGVSGTLLGLEHTSVPGGTLSRIHPFQPRFHYEPNSFVVLFASQHLDTVSWGPIIEQPTWLNHSLSFAAQVLFTDAAGVAQASITFPSSPSFMHQRMWFVGIAGPSHPLQSSPVIGGLLF